MYSQDRHNTGNERESSTKRPQDNNFNEVNNKRTGEKDSSSSDRNNTKIRTFQDPPWKIRSQTQLPHTNLKTS